jgi:nucleoside-diphosphate-sugar epimerase
MRVFLAGATGALGRQLVPLLQSAGHEVSALVRDPERAPAGVQAFHGDALDRASVMDAVLAAQPEAVMHQATALSAGTSNPRRMAAATAPTSRLRTEGTANLLAAADAAGVSRFIAQSIAFAYAPRGPRVLDEDAPLNLDGPRQMRPVVAAVAELERQVLDASGVVLRYGWLYGPGTAFARDGETATMVRRRAYPLGGDGEGIWSFVHVRDAAEAAIAALDFEGSRVFNVVDDHPAPLREWLPEFARLLGAPPPRRVPLWMLRLAAGQVAAEGVTQQRGASNARARAELGWSPRHADWRSGFAEELA